MLTVVTYKWRNPGYRSTFGGAQVDTLRRMVKRNYPHPHRFVCVTDDPKGITEPDVEIFELWDDLRSVPNPSGSKNPSCYVRLKMFARDAGLWLGERIVSMDLDCVITADMSPVWNRPEDFVIWGDTNHANPYNGSMCLFTAGARPQLWEDFDPATSPHAGRRLGYFGSDQAWIAARLGPKEAKWGPKDGVYSYRNEILPARGHLPANARVCFMHGRFDPWDKECQRHSWVRSHYR